jgi:hypothetical protein
MPSEQSVVRPIERFELSSWNRVRISAEPTIYGHLYPFQWHTSRAANRVDRAMAGPSITHHGNRPTGIISSPEPLDHPPTTALVRAAADGKPLCALKRSPNQVEI